MKNNIGIHLESAPCCDCSNIEGESELSTDKGTEQLPIVYLYKVQLTFCSFTICRGAIPVDIAASFDSGMDREEPPALACLPWA